LSTISASPLYANNFKFSPEEIFEKREDGQVVTLSPCSTGAKALHVEGIKGQLKKGKRLIVAIIDEVFFLSIQSP